jgi:hypothetical protein
MPGRCTVVGTRSGIATYVARSTCCRARATGAGHSLRGTDLSVELLIRDPLGEHACSRISH